MTITTKAALAAELDISKARVSQYVAAGLPVREDGKLDREPALAWIADNIPISHDGQDRGAMRASRLVAEAAPKARRLSVRQRGQNLDQHPAEEIVAATLIARAGTIVAAVAVELGLPTPIAYALEQGVFVHLAGDAEQLLKLKPCDRAFEDLLCGLLRATEVDWPKLVRDRGECTDEDAIEAALEDAVNRVESTERGRELVALPRLRKAA